MDSSTLPFVGFCALAAFFALDHHLGDAPGKTGKWRLQIGRFVRSFVSLPNAVGILCVGLHSFLFLKGNSAGAARCLFWWWTYPFFVLAEVVLPMLPLWLGGRRDRSFWFVFLALGAFTPLHEISRTIVNVRRHPDADAYYAGANTGRDQIFGYRLEEGDVPVVYINPFPDSFFPRVLARRPIDSDGAGIRAP